MIRQTIGGGKVSKITDIRKSALDWSLNIAKNQKHGYSQGSRWGPDYDCSSMMITAYQQAGVPVKTKGASYTGDMKDAFIACGFTDVTNQCNLNTCVGMLPSDVLLNEHGRGTTGNGHTAMYIGNSQMVHARGQSFGSSKTGDQGQEIAVTGYYNCPWDCVLRYTGGATVAPTPTTLSGSYAGSCTVTVATMVPGNIGPQVKTVQRLLNAKGYKGRDGKKLDVDGEFGDETAYAVEQMQKKAGMTGIWFGTVAAKTWDLLLK